MPRDLESERDTLAGMPSLTRSPAAQDSPPTDAASDPHAARQRDELHPLVQTLNPSYIESCVKLENAAFPEGQRGSREKFIYRLTVCGELCLGLFTTSSSPETPGHVATADTAHLVESGAPDRKEFLLAMVCATKTRNELVSDDDMNVPPNWQDQPKLVNSTVGHQEDGRTVALHSLAVEPQYQGRGLGRTLLKAYIQRIQTSGTADRISILTYDRLVPFYESVGFENRGASKVQYGGGGWVDMVLEFPQNANGPKKGSE